VLLAGCNTAKVQTAGAPPTVPVSVAIATQESLPVEISAVGAVEPSETVQIKSQIAGELMTVRFVEGRTYYTHLASWWPHRHDTNVLLLAYEHMKDDHEGTVRRVAEFIGFGDDDERIAIAIEESSLASMQAHHEKYDDLLMRERSEVVCDLPLGSDSSKVRSGEVGAHRAELPERLVADLDTTWAETITAGLGIPNYETLLEMLAAGR
jgi:hypothetical protein